MKKLFKYISHQTIQPKCSLKFYINPVKKSTRAHTHTHTHTQRERERERERPIKNKKKPITSVVEDTEEKEIFTHC